MHTLLEKAAARIAAGTAPLENAAEAVELARLPRSENPDIFACAALARARFAGPVFTCAIINAKSRALRGKLRLLRPVVLSSYRRSRIRSRGHGRAPETR